MPVIKSAIKKLRQDKKREKRNNDLRDSVKNAIRLAKKSKSGKTIAKAISTVDKAAKKNIIHKNKAAKLKSTLSKIGKPVSHKVATKPSVAKNTVKQTILKTKKPASKKKVEKKPVSKKSPR